MRSTRSMIMIFVLALILSACGAQAEATPLTEDVATPDADKFAAQHSTSPAGNGLVTFTDLDSNISLDYPEGWRMDQVRGGARSPSVFVFTDYSRIPSLMDKIPPENTALYLTVLQPNPAKTLAGLVEGFKAQWAKEGSVIQNEEAVTLNSGAPGIAIVIDSYLGKPFYYLFTPVGERLVYVEAFGNLEPVPSVALTIR